MTYRISHRRVAWLALLAVAACSGSGESGETAAAPEAYAKDVLVDTDWIEARLGDPGVRIVEVGGRPDAFAEGHLPGAVHLTSGQLTNPDDPIGGQIATAEQLAAALSAIGVEREQTVVLYDRQRNLQAARAYWALKYYQHPEVRVYNGGAPRWTADGRSLVAEVSEVVPSEYEIGAADPEIRTTWQYVVEKAADPTTLMCDTRSADEHLGRDVRAARGGHIPGSINVEWTAAVNQDGTFKSAPELYALYTAAGFAPDREIITYCQSGVRGAHTWFVLRELLGFPDVRLYDGSWAEYGNNPESPVES